MKAAPTKLAPETRAAEEKPAKASRPAAAAEPKPRAASTGEKKPRAAGRFQDLIMEGKLTDGEIFKVVQKEFGLSDDKRYYVSWYRNYLRRQGKNPPAPKAKEGEAAAAPTKVAKKSKVA
jgi:hypothetical protein